MSSSGSNVVVDKNNLDTATDESDLIIIWTLVSLTHSGQSRQRQLLKLRALTKGDRVNVRHEPMFIFLLRNGKSLLLFACCNYSYRD